MFRVHVSAQTGQTLNRSVYMSKVLCSCSEWLKAYSVHGVHALIYTV